MKYLLHLITFTSSLKGSLDETAKLHGTLQHVTFVLTTGSSFLPGLAHTISVFKGNKHRQHHLPRDVHADLVWWKATLLVPLISHSLLPHFDVDPDIWVDASTSWGVGLVI